eukprot:tig00020563_g11214.t1
MGASPAKCYTSTDCSGNAAYTADSDAPVSSVCSNASYLSGKAKGSEACVPAKLFCYTSSDCSGNYTLGKDSAGNLVTEYQPQGVSNADAFARCPIGTFSFKNGNSDSCNSAHKFVACHKDLNCKSTGSNITYVVGEDSTKCPTTTVSWSQNGNGTCNRSALLCYSGVRCAGTPTIAKDAAGNVYSH